MSNQALIIESPEQKIQAIALHLRQKIKGIDGNEIGYLRICDLYRNRSGCSVLLHHIVAPINSEQLIINLMVTRKWKAKHTKDSFENVTSCFKSFLNGKGLEVLHCDWISNIDKSDIRDRFYAQVGDMDIEKIKVIIDDLRLGNFSWPEAERI